MMIGRVVSGKTFAGVAVSALVATIVGFQPVGAIGPAGPVSFSSAVMSWGDNSAGELGDANVDAEHDSGACERAWRRSGSRRERTPRGRP